MKNKRLYVQYKKITFVPPCTHKLTKESRYYLDSEYSKKYNHCMFCAIEAWDGAMPHDEIALCLGVDRMVICQTEKKVVEKLKKKINSTIKSLKEIDFPNVSIKGLAEQRDMLAIEKITTFISGDFDITNPIDIQFTNKKIELDNKIGKALYEIDKRGHHKIAFSCGAIKNKKDFVETLVHELFHALQVESRKNTDDNIADAVSKELSNKYYRKFLKIVSETSKKSMIGRKK